MVVVVAADERDRHAFLAKGSRVGDAGEAAAEYHPSVVKGSSSASFLARIVVGWCQS